MDEKTKQLMEEYGVDGGVAERAREFIEEGLEDREAVEIAEEL